MFRAAAFSIVVMLMAGLNAAWICGVWCPMPQSSHSCCAHQGPERDTQLRSSTSCDPATPPASNLAREETNRAPGTPHLVAIAAGAQSGSVAPLLLRVRLNAGDGGRSQVTPLAACLRI